MAALECINNHMHQTAEQMYVFPTRHWILGMTWPLFITFVPLAKAGLSRAGPRGGGAVQAKGLNRVAQGVSGVEYERGGWNSPLKGGGVPGSSPEIFLKSMSLRMHFRPF